MARPPFWHDQKLRTLSLELLFLATVLAALAFFAHNAATALRERGIASGFGFLEDEAGFGIGEGLIRFSAADTYARAFVVGILNTLRVSAAAIVAATLLGLVLGLMRTSSNLPLAALARLYVELFRNTPQLLQIVVWYAVLTRLPGPRQAIAFGGALLSNRGLALPWPEDQAAAALILAAFALGLIASMKSPLPRGEGWMRGVRRTLPITLPIAAWLATGTPTALEFPTLRGLAIRGGVTLSPEFTALFLGLALYTAAFIAEIVRAGIAAVPRGQVEAARALGLAPGRIAWLIVLPQALRVMIPPAAGQYVSLAKSSSLAVAIGYPDLVAIANTTLNQTGHVIEAILIMSAVYLTISLSIAATLTLYARTSRLQ